jgi:hypothetical protein
MTLARLLHPTVNTSIVVIIAATSAMPLHGMEIKTCGDQVVLSGRVEGNEYQRLKDVLSANPNIKVAVMRNSPGGDADTGYRVGEFFREKAITTYVSGYCYSSCSRFFLGGKERFFTDDYPANKTNVGFHSNYKKNGDIVPGAPQRLKHFIDKYSGGKADEELVNRWVNLQNRKGYAYFFHPETMKREDRISILLCQGSEPSNERWKRCEKIVGHDALSMGVITSLELKRSCDADSLHSLIPWLLGEPP